MNNLVIIFIRKIYPDTPCNKVMLYATRQHTLSVNFKIFHQNFPQLSRLSSVRLSGHLFKVRCVLAQCVFFPARGVVRLRCSSATNSFSIASHRLYQWLATARRLSCFLV